MNSVVAAKPRPTPRPALGVLAVLLGGMGLSACGAAQHSVTAAPAAAVTQVATAPVGAGAGTGRGPVWPLTGLPATGDTSRPALSVKVDNAPAARPQSGLNDADMVVEEPVEGGLSRFLAVFHSGDTTVGPIRSARPVDGALLRALNGGLFAYSGAAAGEIAPTRQYGRAALISHDADPAPYFHSRAFHPPDDVFAHTSVLRASAPSAQQGAPPAWFAFRSTAAPGLAGQQLHLTLGRYSTADWVYQGLSYHRSEQGTAHLLGDGSDVTATNVVVLTVAVTHSGITDANHIEDPFVLAYGSGQAVVLTAGTAQYGSWSRPSIDAPYRFVAANGQPLTLTPGRTWIELVPQPGGTVPAGSYRVS